MDSVLLANILFFLIVPRYNLHKNSFCSSPLASHFTLDTVNTKQPLDIHETAPPLPPPHSPRY